MDKLLETKQESEQEEASNTLSKNKKGKGRLLFASSEKERSPIKGASKIKSKTRKGGPKESSPRIVGAEDGEDDRKVPSSSTLLSPQVESSASVLPQESMASFSKDQQQKGLPRDSPLHEQPPGKETVVIHKNEDLKKSPSIVFKKTTPLAKDVTKPKSLSKTFTFLRNICI
jgi:hypothetical protein